MADGSPSPQEGKLAHVLDLVGEDDLDAVSTANGMVTRLRATIDVRVIRVQLTSYHMHLRQDRNRTFSQGFCTEGIFPQAILFSD